MSELVQSYRTFDFQSHPAVKKMMEDKDKERAKDEEDKGEDAGG